uniref:Reverse transcriptase Ty1/copia-type domain-containing protein n=1 Tax=Tanacetum cinerariifolium TaxID=118510 RepID=A0A699GV00_TANCI|nr:hypothetical protein [Tanacetum cinerariifolium]
MSILRGRESVPGINSRERGNGKKRTTLSSRELHDKELVLVVAGTNSNDFVVTEESIGIGYASKNANNDKPQPYSDAGKKDNNGVTKEITTAPLEATHADLFGDETKVDMSNISTTYLVPSTLNTRIHKDNSLDHVISDVQYGVQTRRMTKATSEQGFISVVNEGKNHKDLHTCLFACFLSQKEPKKVIQALKDPSWIEAMIEAIRLFLAYDSFKDFVVYQMDVKSAFLYGKIEEEVYVCQPLGGQIDKTLFIKRFKDDIVLVQVYVDDIIFGFTRKEMCTEFEKMMHKKFQMSSMGELTFFLGRQVTQKDDGIFISQDKYVDEILKKFGFLTVKTTSTPMETSKPLLKDAKVEDSHLHSVKRIFRYLKGQPKLGLWYHKDSPFNLEAFTDSDYVGASLDRKSTTGCCQFLRSSLISWQCKKQTVVANSTTEA